MQGERTTKVIVDLTGDQNEFITNELMRMNRENSKFSAGYITKAKYLTDLLGDVIKKLKEERNG